MRHRANLGFLVAFLSIGLVRCAEVENTNGHGGPSLSAPGGAGGVSGAGTEQEGGAISAFGGHSPGGTPTSGGAPLGGASFGGNGGTMPGASGAPPSGGIGQGGSDTGASGGTPAGSSGMGPGVEFGGSSSGGGAAPTQGGASGEGGTTGGASGGGGFGGAAFGGESSTTGGDGSGAGAPTPSCSDAIRNGDETDVDCGGDQCPPCSAGDACVVNADCDSNACEAGACLPAHCTDGARNGDESDTDCGGSCRPCALGNTCNTVSDCGEGTCAAGTCRSTSEHCAWGWRDHACGATCLSRTQSDERRCADVLDCYVENDCGPATCGSMDATCGANTLKLNLAPYQYANQVYECLCP
nr:MAG: hypothetical protein DIU78_07530 [Pseudomonadota bacterium]